MIKKSSIIRGMTIFLSFLLFSIAHGYGINGGKGLTHVKSAWNLKAGYLTLSSKSYSFGKTNKNPPVAYWDIQSAISLNLGISDHIELAISPVIYQDTHKGEKGYNIPDDLFVGLKFGSYLIRGSSLTWGVSLNTRFPTGKYHNLFFEPYSAGKVAWGFTGMLSYSKDPQFPGESITVDFNFGYLNHNDIGQKLTGSSDDPFAVSFVTQELRYAIGMKIPSAKFNFSFEIFGNGFMQKPPVTAYGHEYHQYLTPAISYQPYNWLSISVGADFRLSPDIDETSYLYVGRPVPEDFPNYPGWRVHFGFKIIILPLKTYKSSDKDILIKRAESRNKLFEQIIKEQRESESAEEELDTIKTERTKVEKELERLRRILEADQKKKEPDKEKKKQEPPP